MIKSLSRRARFWLLVWAFALSAVLLGHGLILSVQATAFFGAILLAITFLLIVAYAGRVRPPEPKPAADSDSAWDR